MTTNCIRRRVEKMCRTLNIVRKSPHKIRKTYDSILLDNNIDKRFITSQMGHTDITTTETIIIKTEEASRQNLKY